jgi:hypothetical protein
MKMTQKKMVEAEIAIHDLVKVPPNEAIANNVVFVLHVVQVEGRMLQVWLLPYRAWLIFWLTGG